MVGLRNYKKYPQYYLTGAPIVNMKLIGAFFIFKKSTKNTKAVITLILYSEHGIFGKTGSH